MNKKLLGSVALLSLFVFVSSSLAAPPRYSSKAAPTDSRVRDRDDLVSKVVSRVGRAIAKRLGLAVKNQEDAPIPPRP